MVATILSFLPPSDNRPAQQRVDDRERAVDRRVFYDEPRMQSLIASLDESSRIFLKVASDRERSRLPLFPAHFRNWDPELVRFDVDGQLNSFDSGMWSTLLSSNRFILIIQRCKNISTIGTMPRHDCGL